jgi:hypothetical protein
MKPIRLALGSFLFVALLSSASTAQVQRTFVSGLGFDSNPCSRTAPCRTFAQAISQTNSSGEVYVLDSAGYAAFTITKPVSIVAPVGVTAGISVFSGDGITINAGALDKVILRGLTVNSQGGGNGITFNTGGTLHIESCVVNGFLSDGLFFHGAGNLEVKDSIFRSNFNGIEVSPASGTAVATIDQVRLEGNSAGLAARQGSTVTVRNSVASGNVAGFDCSSISSASAEMNIENSVASNNNDGIVASSASTGVATVRVSNSTVTDNSIFGLLNGGSPAVLLSRGNNTVEGNSTDTMGTIGSYSAK